MKYKEPNIVELRKFGIVMFTALLVLSAVVTGIGWWLHGTIGLTKINVLNGIGIFVFLLPGLIYPASLKRVHKYWMRFGMALGWVNSRIILSIVWYFVFTPVSIYFKITGYDAMHRKLDPEADTYWIDRTKDEYNPKHFERQF
jgi:hypothetical protein